MSVHRRSDGKRVSLFDVCRASPPLAGGDRLPRLRLTVSKGQLHIASDWALPTANKGSAHNAVVPLAITADAVRVTKRVGLATYQTPPALHARGALILAGGSRFFPALQRNLEWVQYRDGKYYLLTEQKLQPDLFVDRVTPTVLGDIVYFGSWAMDLETREILWRLPFSGVTFPVVPADGLFLVVEKGRVLHCFRGRGRR